MRNMLGQAQRAIPTIPGPTDPASTARHDDLAFLQFDHGGSVRYPNPRYGDPTEFAFYAPGIPLPDPARRLRSDWLTGR
jgi:hypothetical protein